MINDVMRSNEHDVKAHKCEQEKCTQGDDVGDQMSMLIIYCKTNK